MLGGVKAYIATPSCDYPKDAVLLYLPDVFGLERPNAQVCFSVGTEDVFTRGPKAQLHVASCG